jgi:hypothetical protein
VPFLRTPSDIRARQRASDPHNALREITEPIVCGMRRKHVSVGVIDNGESIFLTRCQRIALSEVRGLRIGADANFPNVHGARMWEGWLTVT